MRKVVFLAEGRCGKVVKSVDILSTTLEIYRCGCASSVSGVGMLLSSSEEIVSGDGEVSVVFVAKSSV